MDDQDAVEARVAEALAALPGPGAGHSVAELRRRVGLAESQGWTCTWCVRPLLPADVGAGRTQVDHVIPLVRGGPRAPWNTELLHAGCNGSKGGRMTARAWALARLHEIDVAPPDPAGLRNAAEAISGALRRIPSLLEDYDEAGLPGAVHRRAGRPPASRAGGGGRDRPRPPTRLAVGPARRPGGRAGLRPPGAAAAPTPELR